MPKWIRESGEYMQGWLSTVVKTGSTDFSLPEKWAVTRKGEGENEPCNTELELELLIRAHCFITVCVCVYERERERERTSEPEPVLWESLQVMTNQYEIAHLEPELF